MEDIIEEKRLETKERVNASKDKRNEVIQSGKD